MTRYAIALGSNLGDRVQHLRAALVEIRRMGEIQGISGLYETAPVGGPAQDPYLNAVVIVECPLQPGHLLDRLQAVESDLGRERSVRWGPRTLDLDIIATDGDQVQTPGLEIPHPRATERRFVLEPLAEVWPQAMVGDGMPAAAARGLVADQEVELLLLDWADASAPSPGRYWVGAQLVLIFAVAVAIGIDGSLPDSGLGVTRIGGGLLLVLGISTVSLAARALGQSLTAMPEPIPGAAMVDTGVYSRARHPIYGGVIMVMLGASLFLASSWAALLSLGLFGFFWAKTTYEERVLRVAHPGYRAYRHRVRHRMIPFVI
jgi:2-amino-4-hydroxy-6-hydroxymethyldihydropteridine diphosphokinase